MYYKGNFIKKLFYIWSPIDIFLRVSFIVRVRFKKNIKSEILKSIK